MAAVLAKIIHSMTFSSKDISKWEPGLVIARVKPISANGIAKTV